MCHSRPPPVSWTGSRSGGSSNGSASRRIAGSCSCASPPAGRQMLDDVELRADRLLERVLDRLDEAQLIGVASAMADLRVAVADTIADPELRAATTDHPSPREGLTTHGSIPAGDGGFTPTLEDDPALGLTHREKMEILFAVMLGLFLGALDQTIVGPALPTIVTQLERQRLLRLGHHHLPAHQHDHRPVLGQAVRPLRPQADLHDRHRHLPGRLGAVRPQSEHGHADPVPGHPGHRRRRAVPGRARDHR